MRLLKFTMAILSIPVLLGLAACTEIGPPIDFTDNTALVDTTYMDNVPSPDHKVVLFEEFTGVHCVNCPIGHQLSAQIQANHPDSVVLVAIHNSNPLADPFEGEEDFRTPEGIQISDNLGGTAAIPCASIDRVDFGSDNKVAEYTPFWETRVKERLKLTPPMNIALQSQFNPGDRSLKVTVTVRYTQTVSQPNHLSVMIIESNIISPQKLPDNSVDSNYVHMHVLRDMLTPVNGVLLDADKQPGRVFIKEFRITLPANWNESECQVVAFVHDIGTNQEVHQATEVAVQ